MAVDLLPEASVRMFPIRVSLLSAFVGLSSLALTAQSWDAARQAQSWAKQDKDDSFTFHDASAKMLHTWTRDGGLMASLPTGKLDDAPERWVMDPRNNAWIAHGSTLTQLDRAGRSLTSTRLPAEVPATSTGRIPASSSTWITPTWAKPRAAPPPRASPIRGGVLVVTTAGGGVTTTSGTTSLGAETQPVRTKDTTNSDKYCMKV